MNNNISMFISYSWNDSMFVEDLDNKLQKYGFNVKRDTRDVEYAQSLKEFMKGIRKTDYSIILKESIRFRAEEKNSLYKR